ncbi:MAG: hypothetical protein O7G83_12920 [Proteobacteria bacterium]|nr:hypothetical protein [Pseudomonadota bacterium]
MNTYLKLLLAAAAALVVLPAIAQEQGHLNVRTVVQKEEVTVSASGETERRLVPAATVVPGDDVIYTITFTNTSEESADNIVITNPLAGELTYVAGSAFGPGTTIEFSVDGGISYAAADELTITEDGEVRPAQPDDFTHIRWVMQNELQAGAQGLARFRARLN